MTAAITLESCGISTWDFAYPDGKCSPQAGVRGNDTSSAKSASRRFKAAEARAQQNFQRFFDSMTPYPRSQGRRESAPVESKQHDGRRTNKGAPPRRESASQKKAYLVAAPSRAALADTHTYWTISALLKIPRVQVVLLVPHRYAATMRVRGLSRLRHARGTSIQVLSVPDHCVMKAGGESDTWLGEELHVAEVVAGLLQHTTAREFDAYITLEEERACWKFLERVARAVEQATTGW